MASPTTTNRSRIFSSFRQRSEGPAKPTCIGVGSPWAMDHPASAPRFEAVGDASPSTDASRVARRRHAKCYESSPARDRQVTIRRETFSNTARPPLRSRPGIAENTWTHPRALDQREAWCLLMACRSACYLSWPCSLAMTREMRISRPSSRPTLPRRSTRSPCSGSTRMVKCHLVAGRLSPSMSCRPWAPPSATWATTRSSPPGTKPIPVDAQLLDRRHLHAPRRDDRKDRRLHLHRARPLLAPPERDLPARHPGHGQS